MHLTRLTPLPLTSSDNTQGHADSQGVINLGTPLVKDELIIVDIGTIDFDAFSMSSTKFTLKVQDEQKNTALTVTTFPSSGKTSLATATDGTIITLPLREVFSLNPDHYILIHKRESQFLVQYDSHPLGAVEAPPHSPLTSVTYDLGTQSEFRGPISAVVFSSCSDLRALFVPNAGASPTPPVSSPMSEEALFQQIVACDPRNSDRTRKALEDLRRQKTSGQLSTSGAKWSSQHVSPCSWSTLQWNFSLNSIFVIRFNVVLNEQGSLVIEFGPHSPTPTLNVRVRIDPDGTVSMNQTNNDQMFHTLKLTESLHLVGEHSVAFFIHGGQVNVIFDFKQMSVLPRLIDRKPTEIYFGAGEVEIELDVYEFGG